MEIADGRMYLFEERVPLRTHQILRHELKEGRPTLYISKHSPMQLRTQFNFDPSLMKTLWLSTRPESDCIPPMNLKMFETRVKEFLEEYPDGIVALNGIDVLEMWNGLRPVLDVLRRAQERVSSNGTNMLISMDPKNYSERTVSEMEKISDEVVCSVSEADS